MKEPFYFVKDIDISEFTNGRYLLEIGNDLMTDIEQNKVYEPNQSLHQMYGEVFHQYNNRLHMGNIKTTLFKGYDASDFLSRADDSRDTCVVVGVCSDDKTFYAKQKLPYRAGCYNHRHKLLAYPDYRADEWNIYTVNKDSGVANQMDNRKLTPVAALNMACYVNPSQYTEKYPCMLQFRNTEYSAVSVPEDDTVSESNRLQVSALNNLFNLPFDLSYFVGNKTATIQAFDTVADQLSDSKFGEFPLYAFTTEGIWALQSGENEIVYSNIIPINHDKILNNNTVAAAYNVFYITNRGLMALQGRYAKLLSTPINDRNNNVLTGYLKDAGLHYQHLNNEVVVHNEKYGYAYIYSIDGGVWSIRDFNGRKLNNDKVVDGFNTFYCFEEEYPDIEMSCLLVTRPLKFGSSEFKRVETLIVRLLSYYTASFEINVGGGSVNAATLSELPAYPAAGLPDGFTNQRINAIIEGSNDLKRWITLRDETLSTNRDITIRRTPLSCKYFRLTLNMKIRGYITLSNFGIELYHRYLHRLR